jgi:hypothetical protein
MSTQNTVIHNPKNDVDGKYRYNSSCECVDCLEDTATQLEDEYLQSQMRLHLDRDCRDPHAFDDCPNWDRDSWDY